MEQKAIRNKKDLQIFIKKFKEKNPENQEINDFCDHILNTYLKSVKDNKDIVRLNNMYEEFRDAYIIFIKQYIGVMPKIDKIDAMALHEIINYLLLNSNYDHQRAYEGWKLICSKKVWDMLPAQFKNWYHLKQISRNLMNIIAYVKTNRDKFFAKEQRKEELNSAIKAVMFDLDNREI